ncbi:MAG: septum formation initiator family protein [Selenomonadaceae bacterium]|nr:septum formation initiator family protein [Selenomonadaceae bacterium]MBR3722489.1 septum formation initiator family protein [Selenomonadaceae bacterium]
MGRKEKGRQYKWIIVAALFIIYFSSVLINQQVHLNQVEMDQIAADSRLELAKRENEELLKERELLNDVNYLEKVAREELGMVKAGEIPYSLVRKDR